MAGQALGKPSSSQDQSQNETDPLVEAQKFTKQMAANAIIESEVAKSKASVAKAEAEAEEARAKAERAKSGESSTKESPVQIKGSVDLGHFNYQEILERQQKDLKDLKQEADQQATSQQAISDDLRERLHAKEMDVMKTSFEAQMQTLGKMIESNASKGTFMDQYNGMIEMAKTLGFHQPQMAGEVGTQMALKKLEFEQTSELRRMAREDKRADREFQRQLNKDADDREADKVERARLEKRDEMFANAPKVLGSAIAQGYLASASKGEGGGITEAANQGAKASQGNQGYQVEAGWGENGQVECPNCHQPVAIGPTARVALCANCSGKLSIVRIGEKPGVEEEE